MSTPVPATPETTVRARQILEQRGIRPTAQRIRIAELLFSRAQHLTADQVIQALGRDGTHVSKATVYNTLNLFVEKGLLRQFVLAERAASLLDFQRARRRPR